MASNEARAAAMVAAEATPIVTIEQAAPAVATETPAAPAQAAAGTVAAPATAEGEAASAKPVEGGEEQPRAVQFTDWQSLKHQRGKLKERETKLSEREAQLTAKEQEIASARATPTAKAFGAKDPAGLIRAWATEHSLTFEQALEALSHQTIHDGKLPQDAEIAAKLDPVQAELARVKKEQDELKQQLANERAELEKRGTSQAFVGWVTSEEVAKKYPVMSAEDPADIAEASWQVAQTYRSENDGKWPTREWVAEQVEAAARAFYGAKVKVFERYKGATEQAVKPGADTGTPNKPEGTRDPASPGGGAQARTLSNKSASERSSGLRENATRDERRAAARRLLG